MKNLIDFGTADATRQPTRDIWMDCPVAEIRDNPGLGWHFYDDFIDFPLVPTETTQIAGGKYKVYATSGSAVVPVSTINSVEIGGGIMSFTQNTNNNAASLAQAYPAAMLTGKTADGGKLWFEACIAMNTLLTATMGWFLGLAEVDQFALSATIPQNADSELLNAGGSLLGFHKAENGLAVIDSAYTDRATTYTLVGTGEGTMPVAYTFTKLGMMYDPLRTTDCIRFFQNGVQMPTTLSKTTLQATTNLCANALGMIFATIAAASGTTSAAYMKWWRIAQLYPGYSWGK